MINVWEIENIYNIKIMKNMKNRWRYMRFIWIKIYKIVKNLLKNIIYFNILFFYRKLGVFNFCV